MKKILLILSALLFIPCNNSFYKNILSYFLIVSSEKGDEKIVNILLKCNADIDMKEDEYGYTALMETSSKGCKRIKQAFRTKAAVRQADKTRRFCAETASVSKSSENSAVR